MPDEPRALPAVVLMYRKRQRPFYRFNTYIRFFVLLIFFLKLDRYLSVCILILDLRIGLTRTFVTGLPIILFVLVSSSDWFLPGLLCTVILDFLFSRLYFPKKVF